MPNNAFLDQFVAVPFRGGRLVDYHITVDHKGGLHTTHIPSGLQVPHVRIAPTAPHDFTDLIKTGAGTAANALVPYLAVANLGVGLLNLGISGWTAWKVHKIDAKMDTALAVVQRTDRKLDSLSNLLTDSVAHLDALIQKNSLMLGILLDGQCNLGDAVEQLRREMVSGFKAIHEALHAADARREAQDMEQRLRQILHYYRICSRDFLQERSPADRDLRQIVELAAALLAWLDTRLQPIPAGADQRLPYLVARTLVTRLEVDARDQLGEGSLSSQPHRDHLLSLIRGELLALTDRAPLHSVSCSHRSLIEQYVFLARAVRNPITIIHLPDGGVQPCIPRGELEWDDGLGQVRQLLSSTTTTKVASSIHLRTLQEHASWQKLTGIPRAGSPNTIETHDLQRVLGLAADAAIPESSLRFLLCSAHAATAEARRRVLSEVTNGESQKEAAGL